MPIPPPAPVPASQSDILEQIHQLLPIAPRLAFDKTYLIRNPLLRERLRRDAFISLAQQQPQSAAALLPQVIDAPWLPALHFAQALDLAWFTVATQPQLSQKLLTQSATGHPAAALRSLAQFIDLPYGPAIRDAARTSLPPAPADLQLLQLKQNPNLPITPAGILRLASQAQTDDERLTAVRLLSSLDWSTPADPATLRAALALLAESGAPLPVPPSTIRRALVNIEDSADPLAEAVKAAIILAASPAAVDDALPNTPLGRVLKDLRQPADPTLHIPDLFPNGLCLQRYVFHNDDDGVESFQSFLAAYANDPNWTLQRFPDRVLLSSPTRHSRRIQIHANVPNAAPNLPASASVLVHRGHDHHFDATRKLLTPSALLVFLGSCRGTADVEDVVTRCRRAQVIATRGVGTTQVNDAFLRALNNRLLQPGDSLDWNLFWASLQPSLGPNEHFRHYLQPHKNPTARFLASWYRHALSEQ